MLAANNIWLITFSLQMPRPAPPPRSRGRRSRSVWPGTRWRPSARSWRSARPSGRRGDRLRPRPRPPQPRTALPGQWARRGRRTRRPSTSCSSRSPSPPEWLIIITITEWPIMTQHSDPHRTWSKAGTSRWFSTKSVANLTIRRLQRKEEIVRVTYFLLNAVCQKFSFRLQTNSKRAIMIRTN